MWPPGIKAAGQRHAAELVNQSCRERFDVGREIEVLGFERGRQRQRVVGPYDLVIAITDAGLHQRAIKRELEGVETHRPNLQAFALLRCEISHTLDATV